MNLSDAERHDLERARKIDQIRGLNPVEMETPKNKLALLACSVDADVFADVITEALGLRLRDMSDRQVHDIHRLVGDELWGRIKP